MLADSPTMTRLEDASEAELIALARERSQDAFGELYARHGREVLAFLLGLVRDRALAEDALQEAFVRAWGALGRFEPLRPFRPWVIQIARNAGLDLLRERRKQERIQEEKAKRLEVAEAADRAEADEAAARAQAALAKLPDELRALLVQRYANGLKVGEIAESCDVSESTVKSRLREAAGLLAQALALGKGKS